MSSNKWLEFRDFTCNQLKDAKVHWEPFWHASVPDCLHPKLFTLVKQHWPDMSTDNPAIRSNPPGFNQNRRIFTPERTDGGFWIDYYHEIMKHPDIIDAVYSLPDLDRSRCTGVTSSLWEDYKGYSVHNHYDGYTIDVAWQLYVYCDGGEQWGTSLNDSDGNELKRFPFVQNRAWLMRVDADSWHSCDEIQCDLRQSVMVRFMTKSK